MILKSIEKRKTINQKVNAESIGYATQFLHNSAPFRNEFWTQNWTENKRETQNCENQKTLQNTARGSKNQCFGFQKMMENCFQNASEGDSDKDQPRHSKKTIFEALGVHFGFQSDVFDVENVVFDEKDLLFTKIS